MRDHLKLALVLGILMAASSLERPWEASLSAGDQAGEQAVEARCSTDSECQKFCPAEEAALPPDHPDYCDGGPGGIVLPAPKVWL